MPRGPLQGPRFILFFIGVSTFVLCTAGIITHYPPPPIEIVEGTGCRETEFRLTCRGLKSLIAIRDAIFTPDNSSQSSSENETLSGEGECVTGPTALALMNSSSSLTMSEDELALLTGNNASLPHATPHMPVDYNLKPALNRRCSGVNHCSFILRDDYAPARDWGPGTVSIRYACMTENQVSRFCGERVDVSSGGEGFLMTPGYPKYYVGEKECTWEVRGAPGQAIGLEVIDLSLRGIGPLETTCTDVLEVWAPGSGQDQALLLLSVCGERSNLPVVRTTSGPLRISARTASKTLFPKRGVLLRYMPLSCPPPPRPPRDGYLVYSNDSMVLYMCCVNMAFNDTGSRRRELQCTLGNTWSLDVPDCVNASLLPHRQPDVDAHILQRAIMFSESDYIQDMVVPSIVIAVLLIGNAFIIALIMHYKRRHLKTKEKGNTEEMGEILPNSAEDQGACV